MQILAFCLQHTNGSDQSTLLRDTAGRIAACCRELRGGGALREALPVVYGHRLDLFAVTDAARATPEDIFTALSGCCGLNDSPTLRRVSHQGIETARAFLHNCISPGEEFLKAAGAGIQDAGSLAGPILNRLYQTGLMIEALAEKNLAVIDHRSIAVRIGDLVKKIFGGFTAAGMLIAGSHPLHDKTASLLAAEPWKSVTHAYTAAEASASITGDQVVLRLSTDMAQMFSPASLKRLMSARKNRPMLILNLDQFIQADPALDDIYNLFVYSLADLHPPAVQPADSLDDCFEQELKNFFAWFYSSEHYRFGSIIGTSRPMESVLELIARISQTDITVLIQGESGTGKELVARAVHDNSPRRHMPFIALNCGALTDTLLESELFGHVKGAFTGAAFTKKGLLEEADGGTLMLDEIAETSPAFQVKLLRVLQQGEMRRVGSSELQRIDVRIIAATNRDLKMLVDQGAFRQDLYYRLAVVQIDLPPLRDRPGDACLLARYFIERFAGNLKKRIQGISEDALQAITAYAWPGNVRELENAMERAAALCIGHTITLDDLPPHVQHQTGHPKPPEDIPAIMTLRDLERDYIARALESYRWDYDRVARTLGIGRTTLWRKIREYGIEKQQGS